MDRAAGPSTGVAITRAFRRLPLSGTVGFIFALSLLFESTIELPLTVLLIGDSAFNEFAQTLDKNTFIELTGVCLDLFRNESALDRLEVEYGLSE